MTKTKNLFVFIFSLISLFVLGRVDSFAYFYQNPDRAIQLSEVIRSVSNILGYISYAGAIVVLIYGIKYYNAWKAYKNESELGIKNNNILDLSLQMSAAKLKFENFLYLDMCLLFWSRSLSSVITILLGVNLINAIIPIIIFGASIYIWATKNGIKASGLLLLYLLYRAGRMLMYMM